MIRLTARFALLACLLALAACSDDQGGDGQHELLLRAQRWEDPGIYDSRGRFLLLRGVNLNTLGDYWAANPGVPPTAAYEPAHFGLMAEYGFNVVRLLMHWSAIEPERGVIDFAYIDRIAQAVEDAAEHGIYVMLDMHQDAWGKYIATPPGETCEYPSKGWDGAPQWATLTEGASTCTESGRRESAPAVYHAFGNFWENTDGIQDHFIAAWQEVVRATAHYPTLLGYDLLNEPSLGEGPFDEQADLYNAFLKRMVRAVREAERSAGGLEHLVFFETTVGWNGQEIPLTPAFDFTQDRNIVFAPHNYFEVIIQGLLTLEQGAALYNNLAHGYGTHCFIGEWGVFGDPATDRDKLLRFAAVEDQFLMGSTWWQWCQAPGDPHGISYDGTQYGETSLHLLEVSADGSYTGVRNETWLSVLSRARPLAIHGKPIRLESDADAGTMYLKAYAPHVGATELWIPGSGAEPVISGTNISRVKTEAVPGGYRASMQVEGVYEIEVGQ